jgi:hypothetical protein
VGSFGFQAPNLTYSYSQGELARVTGRHRPHSHLGGNSKLEDIWEKTLGRGL